MFETSSGSQWQPINVSHCAYHHLKIGSRLLQNAEACVQCYTCQTIKCFFFRIKLLRQKCCEWTSKDAFSILPAHLNMFMGLVTAYSTTTIRPVAIRNRSYWHRFQSNSLFADRFYGSQSSNRRCSEFFGFWSSLVTMSCPKWLPKDLQSSYHLFDEMSRAIVTFRMLTNRFLININVPDLYVSILQTVF